MRSTIQNFTSLVPRLLIVLHDLAMIVAVWVGLRWLAAMAGAPPAPSLAAELVVAVLTQGVVLQMVGLYQGLWRFASVPDLANLVRGALIGVLLIVAILLLIGLLPDVPRRVLFPYPVALVVMLGLPRVLYRLWKDYRLRTTNADAKRVLVLGAGRTAENLLRELASDGRYSAVGLLDDNPALKGAKLQGVPVLGTLDELPYIAQETAPQLLVIAMPSATAVEMQRVVSLCDETGLPFRMVPRLSDMLEGRGRRLALSEVRIEDLLGRAPVEFDPPSGTLAGRRVVVTGAGGSIGSELARQCAAAGVARLVLFERAELPLDDIADELRRDFPRVDVVPFLADCGDPTACSIALAQGMESKAAEFQRGGGELYIPLKPV